MKKYIMIILSLFILLQASSQDDDLTLEEDYLNNVSISKQIQLEIIRNQASSDDLDQKKESLILLERVITESALLPAERDSFAEILGDIALQGTGIIVQNEGRLLRAQTDLRIDSARILGILGHNGAARVLLLMMQTDDSPIVLSQCALSAAKVIPTLDLEEFPLGDELIVQELADAMKKQIIRDEDGHFALGFLHAVSTIGGFNPELVNNGFLIQQVSSISQSESGYNRMIRNRAWEVLEEMQNY
ncbi:MAG: hypothetical protein PF447_08770 [Spirochaetaceae bacterium]|jgi:hypothetical protein|nr:hypothetical protein [Spirochaetaceae bacterium]